MGKTHYRTMNEPPVTPELLLDAYCAGYFPMADSATGGELYWFNPEIRGALSLEDGGGFHIPRSLRKFMRRSPFTVTMDVDFARVIRHCADNRRRGREDTWINAEIIALYTRLHEMGYAHSVEVWEPLAVTQTRSCDMEAGVDKAVFAAGMAGVTAKDVDTGWREDGGRQLGADGGVDEGRRVSGDGEDAGWQEDGGRQVGADGEVDANWRENGSGRVSGGGEDVSWREDGGRQLGAGGGVDEGWRVDVLRGASGDGGAGGEGGANVRANPYVNAGGKGNENGETALPESQHGRLVGGLYGVAIGGAFFGESMFSLRSNASSVALVHLVQRLRQAGYRLLDAQFENPHLEKFGFRGYSQADYLALLRHALSTSPNPSSRLLTESVSRF